MSANTWSLCTQHLFEWTQRQSKEKYESFRIYVSTLISFSSKLRLAYSDVHLIASFEASYVNCVRNFEESDCDAGITGLDCAVKIAWRSNTTRDVSAYHIGNTPKHIFFKFELERTLFNYQLRSCFSTGTRVRTTSSMRYGWASLRKKLEFQWSRFTDWRQIRRVRTFLVGKSKIKTWQTIHRRWPLRHFLLRDHKVPSVSNERISHRW